MLEHLSPITPGKLTGLEGIVSLLLAEDRLHAVAAGSVAFNGGPQSKEYVDGLHRQHEAVLEAQRSPDERAARAETKAADVLSQKHAMAAILAGVESRMVGGGVAR